MDLRLPPYPEYRDSGVEWLGDIPSHWEVRRMKHMLRERVEKGHPREPLLVASQNYGVILKDNYETRTVTALRDLHLLKLVDVGDFVISLRSFQGGIEIAHHRGIISPAYTVLTPADKDYGQYLRLFFKSATFIEALKLFVTGIREGQNINYPSLSRSYIPIPPPDEQAAIVRFLDVAETRIRRYIRAKQKLIKLLNEQKQAIIQQAVTRGLDPAAPMKDSGVAWLGEIPSHWEVVLNQRIFKENIRSYEGTEEVQLSLSQIDGLIPKHQMKERSLQTSTFKNWKITLPDDLVLNRFKAHLGVFFAAKMRGIVTFHYGVFEPRVQLRAKYYELLYHTLPYRAIYAWRSNGMTVGLQNLSNQNFYNVRTLLPPIEEQDQILEHVERETKMLDAAIEVIDQEIDLIREYRTRLIADVVTGKVDVRGVAFEMPEAFEEDGLLDVEEDDLLEEEEGDMEMEADD